MRENVVEKRLGNYIKSKGGLCLKWVSPGFTGVPDRIVLMPGGKIIFVEVKRPGLKDGRTPRQIRVAEQLQKLGFTVLRLDDVGGIDEYL